MELQTLFWALIVTAGLMVVGLIMIGNAIKMLLRSPAFRESILKGEKEKKDKGGKAVGILLLLITAAISTDGYALQEASAVEMVEAAETVAVSHPFYNITSINILLVINALLAAGLIYARSIFKSFYAVVHPTAQKEKKRKRRVRIRKILTDAVPLSEEEHILMNHDYDGITELDNNLPPWWKWGFYLTIFSGIVYLVNYHILKTSPLQDEEYRISMYEAELEVAAYLEAQALNVDENTVTFMDGASDIGAGHALFTQYCIVCHLEGGAGSVGPNLTDDYWLYGNDIKNIFKTIKYGAENGMKSWKDELNPVQMQQVSSYIMTLQGTNPPNPKEPQGDYYAPVNQGAEETTDSDSLEVVTDTSAVQTDTLLTE